MELDTERRYDVLKRLTPGQVGEVLMGMAAPTAQFPTSIPAERALAIVQWVELQPSEQRKRFDQLLEVAGRASATGAEGTYVGYVDDPTGKILQDGTPISVRLGIGSRWRIAASGMEFVWVPAGTFLMGATMEKGQPGFDEQAEDDEPPVHEVTITQGFWLGRFPVTNAQIRRFAEETRTEIGSLRHAGFDGPEQPATAVSWHDAMAFCVWASEQTGLNITLPTEAEWEYAARGTDGRKYPWGKEDLTLERAWFDKQAPAPVGERPRGAGPFLAEEQAGNVWEWCADRWDSYTGTPQRDPGLTAMCQALDTLLQENDPPRVLRGG